MSPAVAPAIDPVNSTAAQAQARVAMLAADHATIVSADWAASTGALPTVLMRG